MSIDPAVYARVFEGHHEGVQILDDLTARFGGALFVKGGEEGRRETDFRLGRRAVLDFIVTQINRANNVADPVDDDPNASQA
jgi:uncharacterized protein (DUF1330 family)